MTTMKENNINGIEMQNDYVMVKDLEKEDTVTKNGLIIPADKYQRLAKIVALPENETHLKLGDVIIKPIGRGTPVKLNGEEYECIKKALLFARL